VLVVKHHGPIILTATPAKIQVSGPLVKGAVRRASPEEDDALVPNPA